YIANYNGVGVVSGSVRQVTKTKDSTTAPASAVVFTYGRRLSRDGRWIAFESSATDPKANSSTNTFLVSFVYDILSDSFTQVGPRAAAVPGDVTHYPTFTAYPGITPATVIFTSALNFKNDGTFPTADQDSTGLNPGRVSQIFAAAIPVQSTGPFTRLTNITGTTVLAPVRAIPSNSRGRIAFSMGGAELGGGKPDFSAELFYQYPPTATTESTATISLFTGASLIPVAVPVASGSPTPSPSPSAPLVAPGLAAGELALITSSANLAPSSALTANASETKFAPSLPVELN